MKAKKFIVCLLAIFQTVCCMSIPYVNAIKGDIDNNGFIDAVDATSILSEYSLLSTIGHGSFTDIQKQFADIDDNGFVDAVDATHILSYYAYTSTGGNLSLEKWLIKNHIINDVQQINGVTYINGIIIANKSYSLPSTYNPGMNQETLQQFELLRTSALNDGVNIYFRDGYRTYDYQNTLYNNFVNWYGTEMADISAARAGHSEHQTGLAIDVSTDAQVFEGTPASIWLSSYAHEYGFIIRYPKGKESITGYKYEPWHIRYLGVEKATEVYNSGLALEEYLNIDSYYH